MAAIAPQLEKVLAGFRVNAPEPIRGPVIAMQERLRATDTSSSIQIGDTFPSFSLSNATGAIVTSESLLAKRPFVITFYRGEWCPFCNIAVAGLQARLPEIEAKGVTLVAATPEQPNGTLTMTEKHDLKFPVLTDLHNGLAKQLGILMEHPDEIKAVLDKFGHDLPKRNGDSTYAVPYPAAFLVSKEGKVLQRYVVPDYTKRVEPQTVVDWVNAL